MEYRRAQAVVLVLLVAQLSAVVLLPAHAELYSLTISPLYTQEANSPGVELSLAVTGANPLLSYNFDWVVSDPSGNTKNTQSSQDAGLSSFTLSVVYPANFGGGAAIEFVGRYSVEVVQTSPPVFPPPTTLGNFDVGLTDKAVYVRTSAVSIRATSYGVGEDVTINVTRGGSQASGFPIHVFADSNGDVTHTWQTEPSTAAGNYTVTLYGSITPTKSPADTQTFRVDPVTLGVTVALPSATLGPSQVLTISVNATYPDGGSPTQGAVTATISTSGFLIGSQVTLGFDQSQSRWMGGYTVKDNDPTGIWLVQVSATDPYGNTGQGSASAFASIPPPQQSPLTSFWFLTVLGAVGVGALSGFLALRRKKTTHHQLQVDLQAVGREADRVKNQEFFRSVQRQLSHMREGPEEKNDG